MDSLDLIQIASEVLIAMVSRRVPSRETVEILRIARPDLSHITPIDDFACEILKSELAKYKEKRAKWAVK